MLASQDFLIAPITQGNIDRPQTFFEFGQAVFHLWRNYRIDFSYEQAIKIVARIHARRANITLVQAELEKLVPITRAETGCIQYDLHQDNSNPAHFMFFENWENRELWQTHMNAPHLATCMAATDGAVENFVLNEMTEVV